MANPEFGQRQDLFNVHVTIIGADGNNKFSFMADKMSGGDVTAKDLKYRTANGTTDMQSLGGARDVNDITIDVLQSFEIYQQTPWLQAQTGKGTANVSKQPLDIDGNAFGKALHYTGRLTDVKPPDTDSTGNGTAATIQFMISAVTPVTYA